MNNISGIYQIQSKIKPERIYIGSAMDINQRWKGHLKKLNINIHHSKKLQNHYNKYGKEDLVFSILCTCKKEQLLQFEQYYLDFYRPWFNISKKAGSPLGVKRSEITKEKIKNNSGRKGKPSWNKGKSWSEEAKLKMSIAKIGKKRSKEACKSISKGLMGNKYNLGKKLSEEHKKNISIGLMGNTFTLGHKLTEEHKRKVSEGVRKSLNNKKLICI